MSLSPADFDFIRELVLRKSAIVLEPGKEYLAEARLTPLARREGLHGIGEMVDQLRERPHSPLQSKIVAAMTTNETSFFRDRHPFEAMREGLFPELIESRRSQRQLDIWCAACSSGQEPYSIAMTLRQQFPELGSWDLQLLATDLNEEMVQRAAAGRFSQLEVNRGLPATMLIEYFERDGVEWQVKDSLRKMIRFRVFNLLDSWATLPRMDLIIMRNVLIYFSQEVKKRILAQVRGQLRPGGYLLLGSAETTLNIDSEFERIKVGKTSCYRPKA